MSTMPSISRSWLDAARFAALEELYRGRSVLCIGVGDAAALGVLADRGAARVVAIDPDGAAVEAAQRRLRERRTGRVEVRRAEVGQVPGRFDVVLVNAAERLGPRLERLQVVRERLAPSGWLVAAAPADEGAGGAGLRYYALHDGLRAYFTEVTMFGQAALVGATLAPFGEEEVEPVLDARLVGDEEAALYVAVAGPRRIAAGYGLVLLPPEALVVPAAARGEQPRAGGAGKAPPEPEEVEAGDEVETEVGPEAVPEAVIEEVVEEAEQLEEEVEELEEALAERDARLAAIGAENARLVEAHRKAVDESARLAAAQRQAAADNARLVEAERQAAAEVERLAAERDRLARDRQRLAAEIEHLSARAGRSDDQRVAEAEQAQAEAEALLAARERGLEELKKAAVRHAEEMREVRAILDERDGYIAELEATARSVEEAAEQVAQANARAAEAESKERAARRRIAELEGVVLRLERGGAGPSVGAGTRAGAGAPDEALARRIAELEAALEKQKARADDLQREAWAHLKARSEAEAAAAEVREDTVRKLKDARKVANLELMRAMEEATKKAVALKEELGRTERERREALAALQGVREELTGAQQAVPALAEARDRITRLERELDGLQGERDQLVGERQEIEREMAALRAIHEELGRVQTELRALRGAGEELGRAEEALAEDRMRLVPVESGPSEADLLRQRNEELAAEGAGLRRRNAETEQELARVREIAERIAAESAAREAAAAPDATEVETLRRRGAELEAVIAEVRQAAGEAVRLLEDERARRENEVAGLRQRGAAVEAEARGLRERNVELESELSRVRGIAESASEQLARRPSGDDLGAALQRLEDTLSGELDRLRRLEDGLRHAALTAAAT